MKTGTAGKDFLLLIFVGDFFGEEWRREGPRGGRLVKNIRGVKGLGKGGWCRIFGVSRALGVVGRG